jgi:hypothetical protein
MTMETTDNQTGDQSTGQAQQSIENLQEQISLRAYELYLERGEQSDEIQNWLDAEKEILSVTVEPMSELTLAAAVGLES